MDTFGLLPFGDARIVLYENKFEVAVHILISKFHEKRELQGHSHYLICFMMYLMADLEYFPIIKLGRIEISMGFVLAKYIENQADYINTF